MPKLKILSGEDVIRIFNSFGFSVDNQRGSHIKLKRRVGDLKQTMTIPNHKELDRGTIKAIYNQALRYISENDLRKEFYAE
ncbi:MAG: type II toxin-antitoxin system HicA family toxin [Candidatus Niyogibacteria bacterium]|nr:MAG: type II toxin-antitoxin system HicA family toxin [Candidatus Niyogibacteria bacterium]